MTTDLFQPTSLDVAGSDLSATIAAIEARGGIVQRMEVTSISGYRLTLAWPVDNAPMDDGRNLRPDKLPSL